MTGDGDGDGDGDLSLGHIRYGGLRQHRGLYATERIEPGEVILRVPANTLAGADVLRERGERYLRDMEEKGREEEALERNGAAAATAADDDEREDRRRRRMERTLIATIEKFRRFAEDRRGDDDDDDGGCSWKDDDGLALFLIGSRLILRALPLTFRAKPADAVKQPEPAGAVPNAAATSPVEEGSEPCQWPSLLPHISILPTGYTTNRLYFSPEELDRMGGEIRTDNVEPRRTDVLRGVEADWRALRTALGQFYDEGGADGLLCQACRKGGNGGGGSTGGSAAAGNCRRHGGGCFLLDPERGLTLDAYKWALSMVYSRSCDFVCQSSGKGNDDKEAGGGRDSCHSRVRRVMAPLLDICNHDFSSHLRHDMDARGNVALRNGDKGDDANAPAIPEGAEITLNFKAFPNAELLLHYRRFFFIGGDPAQ